MNEVMTITDLRKYLRVNHYNARKIAEQIPHSQINERGDLRFLKEDVDQFIRGKKEVPQ
jgi:hypothetical protein